MAISGLSFGKEWQGSATKKSPPAAKRGEATGDSAGNNSRLKGSPHAGRERETGVRLGGNQPPKLVMA